MAEIVGWIISGSFALLADGLHVITDLLFYGTGEHVARTELRAGASAHARRVQGAYVHAGAFITLALFIAYEALQPNMHRHMVQSDWMFFAALIGLVGNLWQWRISKNPQNITERGVWSHNAIDFLASVIVVIASVIMLAGVDTAFMDRWASVGVALVMVISATRLIAEARRGHVHHH